jgi:Cof subfamily protein (haloacid dehalogenase superfamily)
MDFSEVKLVVADMDGTLLNSNHELPSDFHNVFEKLASKEILFAAASGRQYFNILKAFTGIEDHAIFIAENGSFVAHQGNEILVQGMDHETTRQQLIEARTFQDVFPILCGKKKAYVENNEPEFVEKFKLYYDRYEFVDDLLLVEDDEFLKIALCDLAGAESNSYQHFIKKQNYLQVKVSGKIWLDLSHPLANKGRALQVVQKKFGISRDQTMVFADYLNDLEMIRESRYSFAMENAHPDVKKAAQYSAASNDDNGVMRVLYQLL